jgi:DedD protein
MRHDDGGPVQAARTRARQRLVGALVLLGIGVVSFPLLFETQPRPLSPDIPIAAPRDGAATPARTASRPLAPLPVLPAEAAAEPPAAAVAGGTVAAAPGPAPATALGPTSAAEPAAGAKPAPAPAPAPAPVAAAPAVAAPAPAAAASRAAPAAAASRPASEAMPAATGRFVVQVGAFAEERALREARQKAEKLGLKTYIQVIDAEGAKRTRVRVGPFDTREQAEATARKLKSGGLPAAILAL